MALEIPCIPLPFIRSLDWREKRSAQQKQQKEQLLKNLTVLKNAAAELMAGNAKQALRTLHNAGLAEDVANIEKNSNGNVLTLTYTDKTKQDMLLTDILKRLQAVVESQT